MDKSKILGITDTVGDHFTYVILLLLNNRKYRQSINKNIVRKRTPRDNNPFVVSDLLNSKKFGFQTCNDCFLINETILVQTILSDTKSDCSVIL